jgi:aryl-alcohol dehydrogenase-like predicted oxidoreductase
MNNKASVSFYSRNPKGENNAAEPRIDTRMDTFNQEPEMSIEKIQHEPDSTRRNLVQLGALGAALGVVGAAAHAGAAAAPPATSEGATPPLRQLGQSGLAVAALGLGCMGMSEFYGAIDERSVQRTLAMALERGVTLFDSADMYGSGANEVLLGNFLRGRRSRAVVATKFGIVRDKNGWHIDNRPAYVKAACEASLRRLGSDHIDVYYAHRIHPGQALEDMIGAMADLVREGKVGAIGLSEAAPATIRRAHAIHPIAAVETEYSLFSRDPEREILPLCAEIGAAFVPYAPLSRGLLSGKAPSASAIQADDFRKNLPRFQPDNHRKNQAIVAQFTALAAQRNCSSAALALAWLLGKGPNIIPIPGTQRADHLAENMSALAIRLSPAVIAAIERLFPVGAAHGKRYTDDELKTVDL